MYCELLWQWWMSWGYTQNMVRSSENVHGGFHSICIFNSTCINNVTPYSYACFICICSPSQLQAINQHHHSRILIMGIAIAEYQPLDHLEIPQSLSFGFEVLDIFPHQTNAKLWKILQVHWFILGKLTSLEFYFLIHCVFIFNKYHHSNQAPIKKLNMYQSIWPLINVKQTMFI